GATETGNIVRITTGTTPHGYQVGQTVVVSGVGVSGYNGTFQITSVTPTSFTYTDPTAGLGNSGGGTAVRGAIEPGNTVTITTGTPPHNFVVGDTVVISGVSNGLVAIIAPGTAGASEVGNTVTINTTAPHGLSAGQQVAISGVSDPNYNGVFTILSVT